MAGAASGSLVGYKFGEAAIGKLEPIVNPWYRPQWVPSGPYGITSWNRPSMVPSLVGITVGNAAQEKVNASVSNYMTITK